MVDTGRNKAPSAPRPSTPEPLPSPQPRVTIADIAERAGVSVYATPACGSAGTSASSASTT